MKISAGISIVYDKKILMVKPPRSTNWEKYTPPKGGIESGETLEEAASREVYEEVGIHISPDSLKEKEMSEINYTDKSGRTYKKVFLFLYPIDSLEQINLKSETIPNNLVQEEEIGDARFMSLKECKENALKRYLPYLSRILF